jgi:hypothetical protein
MPRGHPQPPNESQILREVATRKIEAERTRSKELEAENDRLKQLTADLQRKISLANARASEFERKLKEALKDANREQKAELRDAKDQAGMDVQAERDRWEKKLTELELKHQREFERFELTGQRDAGKLQDALELAEQQLADAQVALTQERQAHQQVNERLRGLEQIAKRIGVRTGQVTGFEVDTPEELFDVLSEVDPEQPLRILRSSVRNLRSAASNVERAFTRALRNDEAQPALQEAGDVLDAARELPETSEIPPAAAMLVEEAFILLTEEVEYRVMGRHHAALVGALATELVRVLRNHREDLGRLQRLVEIAEDTELATPARLILKGATSHQQEIAAARLLGDELKQVRAEAREQKGRVKKLYAVAEQGIAGEWAVNALQAMAGLQPLPTPDAQGARQPLFNRVIQSAKLVLARIDSAMNLGAEAEAGLREADDAYTGLEGLAQNLHELLAAARRELMSGVEGEEYARLRMRAARETLLDAGRRGKRAAAIFDEVMKVFDALLNQWKATFRTYSELSRDMDRIQASIDGAMIDISQPLESDEGKRLYQIIHDLSEHLPEFRALATLRQRMFFHLENPRQRVWELKQVLESSGRICDAVGEPDQQDHVRNYQLCMARMYQAWARLEEVRGGSHSQLVVTAEQVEPVMSDVMVWLSSNNVEELTDGQRDEVMLTAAYLRKLKRDVLGIHDLTAQGANSERTLTAQFEQSLESITFPPEWSHLLQRLRGKGPQEMPATAEPEVEGT